MRKIIVSDYDDTQLSTDTIYVCYVFILILYSLV